MIRSIDIVRPNPEITPKDCSLVQFAVPGFRSPIPIHIFATDGGIEELRIYDPNNVFRDVDQSIMTDREISKRLANEGYEWVLRGDIKSMSGRRFKHEQWLITFNHEPYESYWINPPAPMDLLTRTQQDMLF